MLWEEDRNFVLSVLRRLDRQLDKFSNEVTAQLRDDAMATKETLDRLAADVKANTDGVAAAKAALDGYVATVADLTKKLQDALASDDEAAVKAAADALEQNNADLRQKAPEVAAAVVDNTSAASTDAGASPPS